MPGVLSKNKAKRMTSTLNKLRMAVCKCKKCVEDKYAFALVPYEDGLSKFGRHGVVVKSIDLTHKRVTEKQKGAIHANEVRVILNTRSRHVSMKHYDARPS
jgi:hypothetical protein